MASGASTGSNQDAYFHQKIEQGDNSGVPMDRIKRKRNRVPVACFACRTLKTKCDGTKPVCSTCAASGEVCQYSSQGITPSVASVTVNQEYLSSLERRLAQVEQKTSHDQGGDDTSSHSGTIILPTSPANQTIIFQPTHSSNTRSIMFSADPDVFMGGVNFTQLILNAMNSRKVGIHAHSPNLTRDESFPIKQSELLDLPHNSREMLSLFLGRRHQLSPIFHVPTISALFESAMTCEVTERGPYRYTLAIMNMIFAICSSHQLLDSHVLPSTARRFFDIGIELLQPTLLQDWSLEKVQALLLGTRYLQSSNSPDECWNILGLAIRIAYGLELHHRPPNTDGHNIQETKKRVWNACFTLDKLLSMVYCRPSAISTVDGSCPLPEDLEDDCIFEDRILRRPTPLISSSMAFGIEVGKLYKIMESATELSKADLVSGEVLAQSVVSLDERYKKWYDAVPAQLILDPRKVTMWHEKHEQPLILALRANMVRILIHRQSLALILRGITDATNGLTDSIKSGMLQHSREICVKAAMDTIDIVGLRHESSQKASGPSWFNLYYLFNSILILVSHVLDPNYHGDKLSLARLDIAFAMITTMSADHAFAQRAHVFLQQLLSFMDNTISKSHPSSCPGTTWDPGAAPRHLPIGAPIYQQVQTGVRNGVQEMANSGSTDLFALFGYTQDLTQNLGTHLDHFETVGEGMWSWDSSNSFGGPQASV